MLSRLLVAIMVPLLPLGCVVASAPNPGTEPSAGGASGTGGHGKTGGTGNDNTGGAGNDSTGGGAGGDTASGRDAGKDTGGGVTWSPWVNAMGDLLEKATEGGGEVFLLSSQPGTTRIIAGLGHSGLWDTHDGGQTWERLGVGDGGTGVTNLPTALIYDPDDPKTFWESGSYGEGVFETVDDGLSFQHLGNTQHDEIASIDFTDKKRKTLLAGAHEQRLMLFLSGDGGDTWTDIGPNLPPDSDWSSNPQIIDTNTFLLGSCGLGSSGCGVYRSTDRGKTWTRTSTQGPTGRPLWTSKGEFYWQLAVTGVIVSTDQGVTWTLTDQGPVHNVTGTLQELPDGRVVALGTDHLLATSDGGKKWKPIGAKLPYGGGNCNTYGFTYSPELKKFFINHNNCSGNLLADAIYSEDFDYTKE